jgi:hypothetical protein
MNLIDIHDPQRVNRTPDDVEVLLSSGNFVQDGFTISKVELRLYKERTDEKLGDYSLITSVVETDKGSVEIIYDEGFRGEAPLSRAAAAVGVDGFFFETHIDPNIAKSDGANMLNLDEFDKVVEDII